MRPVRNGKKSGMHNLGFGPYHGLWLEDATTKCIGVTPTPWAMTHALGSEKNVTGEILMRMNMNANTKLIFC
jgi:hypothetical protein